jgi:hypothetical protein
MFFIFGCIQIIFFSIVAIAIFYACDKFEGGFEFVKGDL